jgi:phage portal protein BeeE
VVWNWTSARQLAARQAAVSELLAEAITPTATVPRGPSMTGPGPVSISESAALTHPTLRAAVDAVSHAVASMPLRATTPHPDIDTLLSNPVIGGTRYALLRATARDLIMHGRAWWLVVASSGAYPTRVPRRVERIPAGTVTVDGTKLRWTGTGGRARAAEASEIIGFDTGAPGICAEAGRAIRAALDLEATAARLARVPMPHVVFSERPEAIPLTREEQSDFLDGWEESRAEHTAAFLSGGAVMDRVGWSSSELQLVEARAHADVVMARLVGLDPAWLAAGAGGSSLTYSNRQDLRAGLVDGPVRRLADTIEQRLSLGLTDVDPALGHPVAPGPGRTVHFDYQLFLRADLAARASVAVQLVEAGVWTTAEASDFVSERWD